MFQPSKGTRFVENLKSKYTTVIIPILWNLGSEENSCVISVDQSMVMAHRELNKTMNFMNWSEKTQIQRSLGFRDSDKGYNGHSCKRWKMEARLQFGQ